MTEDRGFLVPEWHKSEIPTRSVLNDASLVLGATIPLSVISFVKIAVQTRSVYERRGTFTPFVIMCWAEWVASVALATLSYVFLSGGVGPSFWVYFFMMSFWVVEMQCILQIIVNRVALVASNPSQVHRIRIAVFCIATMINISGYPIWIPARLQITTTWENLNWWWDRTEKVIYALVDVALNAYFMYHVRTKLIRMGLSKYKKLLYANLGMACLSVGMDILVIVAMSLPSGVVYAQFHPLQFTTKLLIELFMADFIAKIVREDNQMNTVNPNMDVDTAHTGCNGLPGSVMASQGSGGHHYMHRKTVIIDNNNGETMANNNNVNNSNDTDNTLVRVASGGLRPGETPLRDIDAYFHNSCYGLGNGDIADGGNAAEKGLGGCAMQHDPDGDTEKISPPVIVTGSGLSLEDLDRSQYPRVSNREARRTRLWMMSRGRNMSFARFHYTHDENDVEDDDNGGGSQLRDGVDADFFPRCGSAPP